MVKLRSVRNHAPGLLFPLNCPVQMTNPWGDAFFRIFSFTSPPLRLPPSNKNPWKESRQVSCTVFHFPTASVSSEHGSSFAASRGRSGGGSAPGAAGGDPRAARGPPAAVPRSARPGAAPPRLREKEPRTPAPGKEEKSLFGFWPKPAPGGHGGTARAAQPSRGFG